MQIPPPNTIVDNSMQGRWCKWRKRGHKGVKRASILELWICDTLIILSFKKNISGRLLTCFQKNFFVRILTCSGSVLVFLQRGCSKSMLVTFWEHCFGSILVTFQKDCFGRIKEIVCCGFAILEWRYILHLLVFFCSFCAISLNRVVVMVLGGGICMEQGCWVGVGRRCIGWLGSFCVCLGVLGGAGNKEEGTGSESHGLSNHMDDWVLL